MPTLVMHLRDDALHAFEFGREVAAGIPGARFVPLHGRITCPWNMTQPRPGCSRKYVVIFYASDAPAVRAMYDRCQSTVGMQALLASRIREQPLSTQSSGCVADDAIRPGLQCSPPPGGQTYLATGPQQWRAMTPGGQP